MIMIKYVIFLRKYRREIWLLILIKYLAEVSLIEILFNVRKYKFKSIPVFRFKAPCYIKSTNNHKNS